MAVTVPRLYTVFAADLGHYRWREALVTVCVVLQGYLTIKLVVGEGCLLRSECYYSSLSIALISQGSAHQCLRIIDVALTWHKRANVLPSTPNTHLSAAKLNRI